MKLILVFLLSISINSLFAQVNLPLGLKAYYPFTGNANDVSGNNNNPVFNNAILTADRFGNANSAYRFNGTSSYMRIPNNPTLNMPSGQISLSVWVKPTGYWMFDCKNNAIIMKLSADYEDGNYSLRFVDWPNGCTNNNNYDNEKFGGITGSGANGGGVVANTPTVQLNQWYNVVYTNDGIKSKIYVNCILRDSSINVGPADLSNSSDLFFGHLNSPAFPYWLNGDLDEVRIYDRALNQDEVNVLGGCSTTNIPCNNWLNAPTFPSTVNVSDLTVTGNKITVEGSFNCTAYSSPNFGGNLIAKHTSPANVSYALSPHAAEISTSNNGYVFTLQNCNFELNKTYHVAMVYDGASLKFYRNGFLLSQVPCSGNISINNLPAIIGNGPALPIANQFFGNINELRIWNVAKTQAEIRTFMNTTLPNPTTQSGLVAYYTFDNLLNKQGNAAYNGTLSGGTTINSTNPNCTYVADSCVIVTNPCSIDSVRFTNTQIGCLGFNFSGQVYPNTANIQTWQWYFGDGGTANTQNTSHTYLTASTYTVKLVVTDINGCKDSVFRDVVTGGFAVNASADTSFCSNTFVTRNLQATIGATIYSWTPSIPLNNATIPNPTATVNATTKFYVTATNTLGCVSIDSVTIFVNALPIVNTLKDTNVCRNATLVLTTTAGLTTYLWSPGIYVSDSTSANPIFINNNSRRLYVTGTNANGCSASDTIDITVLPLPPVKTLDDTLICSTNPILLTTTGAATYSWFPINNLSNPTIFNPLFNGNQDATYYVTGTGSNGCKAVDTLNIYVNIPTAFNTPPNKLMCQQQSVMLDGANGLRVNYTWSPATFLTSTSIINPIANPPSTTPYSVVVNDKACNLTQSFTVTVTVLLKPFVVATKLNDIDCAFKNAQLQVSGATDYVWSPSNGLNSTIINNPTASIPQKYYVTGTTGNGCFNRDSVEVFNNKAISLGRYIPNAFTPNGDNINDCLQLKNWMYVEILQFSIFNRWGERVFFTTNINRCWDGTYKGKKAEAGNYIIIVKAKTKCGIEEQKANVLLIR